MRYDLIVVGGGIAGVGAAVSAAREGMKVLLIESFGSLGGAMSNSLVYPFMRHYYRTENGKVMLSTGIFAEMVQRRSRYQDSSWETFKFVFDDMLTEAGVELLFHATVFAVKKEGRRVTGVEVATKAGPLTFEADFFIDASGDGDLLSFAGCEMQLGRESDNFCQPMTTCFRFAGVDTDLFQQEEEGLQKLYKEEQEAGRISNPRENILAFIGPGKGILHLNTTRIIKHDPTDPFQLSRAEVLARRQVAEMADFLKKHSKALANATLISVANHIGIRESRKLVGVHVLSVEELKSCVAFEDSVALGNYDVDIHNPVGTGTYIYRLKEGDYYRIPYRSLLPKELCNVLAAGRCLSADHGAHSAVRIMPICACLGEAAGLAAALCQKTASDAHSLDVSLLQAKLKEKGARF